MIEFGSCFNLGFIDTEKLSNFTGESNFEKSTNRLNETTNNAFEDTSYDKTVKNNKFNSFPMRKKNAANFKNMLQGQKSFSNSTNSNAVNVSKEELNLAMRLVNGRHQENNKMKNLLRSNFWPINHPIRKYLWKCILLRSSFDSNDNPESNLTDSGLSEFEYNKHLNQIFGKSIFQNLKK